MSIEGVDELGSSPGRSRDLAVRSIRLPVGLRRTPVQWHQSDHSLPCDVEIKNMLSFTSIPNAQHQVQTTVTVSFCTEKLHVYHCKFFGLFKDVLQACGLLTQLLFTQPLTF
jgi:hypothetical protein